MTYEEHQGWGLDDPTQAMCKRSGQWPVFLSKVLPATWALEIMNSGQIGVHRKPQSSHL